ncbi:hypothetical protein PVAP13_8NG251004 [Panicum virgatum]|uniref:Uncharacterized protein n=1 Tax=Panicum virgatum TaxID=38727 RepID=A0A8T0PA97_PANVG|nr:hypothetical protein PVAP13_8NG251004 [Panicum virgatum]
MVWFVLNNYSEVEPYMEICRKEIVEKEILDVEKTLENQFSSWFKKHITKLRFMKGEEVSDGLYAL